jgi:hypothetical protein
MANTKVFSWKIDNNKYGYLYIPGKSGNGLISDRIIDNTLLGAIADEVSSWDFETYRDRFNTLNQIISSRYNGAVIPGDASRYFNQGAGNYIVLTGKDGSDKSGNSGLSEEVVRTIKNIVYSNLQSAKEELRSEANSIKDYTIGKFNENIERVTETINSAKLEMEGKNAELSSKLERAETSMAVAAELFDMNSNGITKENLSMAIHEASEAKVKLASNDLMFSEQRQLIDRAREDIVRVEAESSNLRQDLTSLSESTTNRFSRLENDLNDVSNTVESMKNSEISVSTNEQNFSRGSKGLKEDELAFVDTIENEDGSYDFIANVGNENYKIKIYGYGKKIKVREVEDGLVLASNGFRYKDSSGSIISMIGGNILLSNGDGSGKLEIKKDGLYINGVKQ